MSFVNGPSWTENISGTPGVPDGSYQVTSIMGSWAWGLLPGAVVGNGLDLFGGDQVGMDIWHASPQCPSCGHIFSSARDWVDAGTRWTGLGVTAVVAAPVVATVGAAANTGVIATFAEDPRAWQGTIDVVHGVFRPRSTPTTPEGLAIRIIMMYLTN